MIPIALSALRVRTALTRGRELKFSGIVIYSASDADRPHARARIEIFTTERTNSMLLTALTLGR